MLLIDTHAHLYYDNMYENLSEVLRLAESNHVKKIICIGTAVSYTHLTLPTKA